MRQEIYVQMRQLEQVSRSSKWVFGEPEGNIILCGMGAADHRGNLILKCNLLSGLDIVILGFKHCYALL